jgi:opacity protein-like surface antigen
MSRRQKEGRVSIRARVVPLLLVALSLGAAARASADATAFIGLSTAPATRSARGFAVGVGFVIFGVEFEYASVRESLDSSIAAPSLRSGMVNGIVQTPFPIARMRFYATVGAGVYRERLGDLQETNVGVNTGGGVKITLAGPLRIRLDYRIFKLNGQPIASRPQRFYAGLNLAF